MKKLEKDGKVAVLVSPGYGAGWSTWTTQYGEELCMDADIVEAVLAEDYKKAVKITTEKYGEHIYTGGVYDLVVEWVPKGAEFEITEYDGYESLHLIGGRKYWKA